jgi:hypothetical protein
MMMYTQRGLAVSTDSCDVIDSIDHFHQQVLASGLSAGNILDAAQRNPSSLLIHIYAAAYYLYAQEYEVDKQAQIHLLEAEKLLEFANIREQIIYDAILNWYQRDYIKAIHLLENVIELFP